MSLRLKIILTALAVLVTGLGLTAILVIHRDHVVIARYQEQVIELTKQIDALKPPLGTPLVVHPPSPPPPSVEGLDKLSAVDVERIKKTIPSLFDKLEQVEEISPGKIVAVSREKGDNADQETVLFMDLNADVLKEVLSASTGEGGPIRFVSSSAWKDGIVIEVRSSPGEAVSNERYIYLDANGDKAAETISGDFNRNGGNIQASIGSQDLDVDLIQGGSCDSGLIKITEDDWRAPSTTLKGLSVNGRSFLFKKPVVTECQVGYGDSVGPPQLPTPDFDGNSISFHLPGHDVAINAAGIATYTVAESYKAECNGTSEYAARLLYDDETGTHTVLANIWNDPVIKADVNGNLCLRYVGIKNGSPTFEAWREGTEDANIYGTFHFDPKTQAFSKVP